MRRWRWVLVAAMLCAYFLAPLLAGRGPAQSAPLPTAAAATAPSTAAPGQNAPPAQPATPAAHPAPYRAVWLSYLEWHTVDFSTQSRFTAAARSICRNVAAAGGTVILAQVRPFGDALYPSRLFPFSHLCTGTQGKSPGYDPLQILVTEAHAAGLELEAWLNPYRLRAGKIPAALSPQSPAERRPDWVKTVAGGLYLDPANPAVRQYIADGITELCENYPLDGIHFDDYFYPTTDPAFDAADYQAYCAAANTPLSLADWRRANVNALVKQCYAAAHRQGVRFGVAPLGDIALNRAGQYSDVALWLRAPGYADYLLPQLYWGLDYTKNGDTTKSFAAQAAAWAALPKHQNVRLYAGLGAYRIGVGDGGDAPGEWQTGHALADQARAAAAQGFDGVALYRYASLWGAAPVASSAAAAERQNLEKLWRREE